MNPGAGALRGARGALLAALTGMLAVAGHLAGGGHLPPLPNLLATAVLLGATFAALAGKQRGPVHLLLAAIGSQLLFHAAFVLVGHSGDRLLPDTHLLTAHLAVAAVLAVLAAHADTIWWALVHLVTQTRIPCLVAIPVPIRSSTRPCYVSPVQPRVRLDADARALRGPPARRARPGRRTPMDEIGRTSCRKETTAPPAAPNWRRCERPSNERRAALSPSR
ncbi:hypothetical protein SAMN05421678_104406 [Actinopolymorpha cephalotaxi]|uniref:Uncharacterized protein n=1 Tax=Actinopolymorpha cephalotaxi TaxID=504797 RepID=A0A1I2QB65_9ACTN|nr:hypothetical protein [Actinopolymorpha cephalotaxi]NYH83346.1 hypothetical protein [Actinopolymorpha cephalotaxi]SFG23507.1 hypothetical protein SAMN05421678_104406 [Actinopolymorpha cephalotaxi]